MESALSQIVFVVGCGWWLVVVGLLPIMVIAYSLSAQFRRVYGNYKVV